MVAPLPPVDKSFAALEAAAAQLTPLTDDDIRAAAAEQAQLQAAWAEDIRQLEDLARESEQAIPVCQEYLRQERPREAWDCESVLSTLSTTDNLPTVLADNRRYLSRKQLQRGGGGASSAQSVVSQQSQQSRRLHKAAAPPPVNVAQLLTQRPAPLTGKIVLSGRLNLPAGFTPRDLRLASSSGASSGAQSAQMHRLLADAAQTTATAPAAAGAMGLRAVAEAAHEDAASDEEEEEGEEDASSDEEVASNVRRRGRETAEERRARKAAVKEARRHKRASKKQLKESFVQEQAKLVKTLGRESAAIEHVSVFRYSA